ncbi:hypothetical protein CTAYLR_006397 [Chrysophaeum taylorii]|uniref:3'(2'),5'-bisphosphate nucleotidase 1 n=1 Tax=Chrysophaeum taylorii TaxID=2483200 RepID=A0AAD7XH77_9STRA|nr:hypothetical protein CTAYLR_006397 [Chrysophaeum taylorii]
MEATNSTFGKFSAGGVDVSIDEVAQIAKKAGDAIMKVYTETPLDNWASIAKSKGDGSPLTIADKAANDIICKELAAKYPFPIMSEENAMTSFAERSAWKYYWCVDPLDGTKEFIKRNGQFTVNIGLVEGSTPIAGVVYVPATAVMYKGVKGLGPPVRETDDPLGYDSYKSIFCARFEETDPNLKIVASASHNTPETEQFIAKYTTPSLQSYGSSLKLLMVAEGRAHVYPRLAPTMEWDTCAAHAIVECAGGEVLQFPGTYDGHPGDLDEGKPLRYNKKDVHNPFFVVYGKREAKTTRPKKDVDLTGGGTTKIATKIIVVIVAGAAAFFAFCNAV